MSDIVLVFNGSVDNAANYIYQGQMPDDPTIARYTSGGMGYPPLPGNRVVDIGGYTLGYSHGKVAARFDYNNLADQWHYFDSTGAGWGGNVVTAQAGYGFTFWGILGVFANKPLAFYIDTTVSGPGAGDVTVSPGTHVENKPGLTYNFTVTLSNPSYSIDSCQLDGVDVDPTGFTIVGAWLNRALVVVTSASTITITGTLTYSGGSCDRNGNFPVTQGGAANFGGSGNATGDLYLASSGTVTSSVTADAAYDVTIFAHAFDLRARIASFVVNGVAQPLRNNVSVWKALSRPQTGNITFSVDIIGDRFCTPGINLPPIPGSPPGTPTDDGSGGGLTGTEGSDPGPGGETGGLPPGGPYGPGPTGPGPGAPEGPGIGGGGNGTPVIPTYTGPKGANGLPLGELFPPGLDWDTGDLRGLILRWRDNCGRWSKEKTVDWTLGAKGDTHLDQHAHALGRYRTRQYEIVMVDRVPFMCASIEENVTPWPETTAAGREKKK